ncbi:HypC/HybG/HupF family hydrogenase formation chaperone [Acetobacter lambici]|uniref:HypC/HybG/HupF family hydrogenase formation chaperone n=1 Tax=Acetobacter lambici TaxID=1332824 RepID=A0ABT1F0T4_9PROT|nr:HypC/HybG/HupF family hydrogenase formation chaperone [Acetobacter lambici]MCP1242690.1 HypC/HybG/HupF family hydrogenase formation chaperone [Acetobacter lambici]MCP1258821.1 HypC/HybG/HupF family hydrogenase formation chaperone [Acetobacter lambici]NHO57130.1 HypC/HybG/HupF family hydrogenase formation chaperone [Acetobacter lambici]
MCLGIPGQITAIVDEQAMLAEVDVSGVRRQVDVLCVAQQGKPLAELVGTWVLVHVGFAMSRIDETEARETLRLLASMDELAGELDAMRTSAQA